jgi:hypothetical protein
VWREHCLSPYVCMFNLSDYENWFWRSSLYAENDNLFLGFVVYMNVGLFMLHAHLSPLFAYSLALLSIWMLASLCYMPICLCYLLFTPIFSSWAVVNHCLHLAAISVWPKFSCISWL